MEELVELAKKGDKQAFTSLVMEEQQILYKIAKSRLQDMSDIEDAIQDTMVTAYTKIKQLKDNQKFPMWLCKILINICNKMYEKKKIMMMQVEELEEVLEDSKVEEASSYMEYEEILKMVDKEEGYILLLYYEKRYTTKQIAQILDRNENTIKTKLKRTKEKLRKKLEGGV